MKWLCVLVLLSGMWPLSAWGGDFEKCAGIVSDAQRLSCYDQAAAALGVTPSPPPAEAEQRVAAAAPAGRPVAASFLGKSWELDGQEKTGTFHFREYKPVYILPLHYSNNLNPQPSSPAAGRSALSPMPTGGTEVKYQLSFKTKLWEKALDDNGDFWFAYTQQSHWLLYDQQVSSPFRETDYEPELIYSRRMDVDLPGMRWRMLNLGLVHQSNGRGLPLSRSWNRVYAQFGLEREKLALFLRPWLRLPDSSDKDDNPDISDYMGHGDVELTCRSGGNIYSALGRYSIAQGHGALQLSWAFPISHTLKGYLQLFSGYGESLIDYNHSQTSIGVGISLQDWQ